MVSRRMTSSVVMEKLSTRVPTRKQYTTSLEKHVSLCHHYSERCWFSAVHNLAFKLFSTFLNIFTAHVKTLLFLSPRENLKSPFDSPFWFSVKQPKLKGAKTWSKIQGLLFPFLPSNFLSTSLSFPAVFPFFFQFLPLPAFLPSPYPSQAEDPILQLQLRGLFHFRRASLMVEDQDTMR